MTEARVGNGDVMRSQDEGLASSQPATVLVVEHDEDDFDVIHDLLAMASCVIERVPDLVIAQQRVREHDRPVDLVIANLYLEDDWPTVKLDALVAAWNGKPIIVVSGCSSTLHCIGSWPNSAIALFDKNNFDPEDFLAVVGVVIGGSRRLRSLTSPVQLLQ